MEPMEDGFLQKVLLRLWHWEQVSYRNRSCRAKGKETFQEFGRKISIS